MSLRSALRAQTADCHAGVDALFGNFSLSDIRTYKTFLRAHARVVPSVEAALEQAGIEQLLPDWPERRRARHLEVVAGVVAEGCPDEALQRGWITGRRANRRRPEAARVEGLGDPTQVAPGLRGPLRSRPVPR